jgi:cyclase
MRARKSVGEGEMTRLISCTLGVVLAGLAGAALAQQSPPSAEAALALAPAPEQVKDLGRGVYVITGALDNTTVVVGPTGLIVVDDQFAPRYPAIMEKISAISPKPIIYLINTHYHGDHTGSNAQFRQHGVRILAHANVAARLRNPPPDPITGRPAPPAPPEAIPEVTYSGVGTTINAGGITAELVHPAPAHTDGDSVVIFPAQDLILTGDLTGNHYPNIDVAVGGGIDGTLRAVDMIIARCGEHTRVVPGHPLPGHAADGPRPHRQSQGRGHEREPGDGGRPAGGSRPHLEARQQRQFIALPYQCLSLTAVSAEASSPSRRLWSRDNRSQGEVT